MVLGEVASFLSPAHLVISEPGLESDFLIHQVLPVYPSRPPLNCKALFHSLGWSSDHSPAWDLVGRSLSNLTWGWGWGVDAIPGDSREDQTRGTQLRTEIRSQKNSTSGRLGDLGKRPTFA